MVSDCSGADRTVWIDFMLPVEKLRLVEVKRTAHVKLNLQDAERVHARSQTPGAQVQTLHVPVTRRARPGVKIFTFQRDGGGLYSEAAATDIKCGDAFCFNVLEKKRKDAPEVFDQTQTHTRRSTPDL